MEVRKIKFIFLFGIVIFICFVTESNATTLSVPIGKDSSVNNIGEYIQLIYNYAISIVGIVATIMLMFGGFTWLTAGGSGEKVGKARDIIFGSLTGLVLALTSYTILNLVNPDLVKFKVPHIQIPGCKTSLDCSPPKICSANGVCVYNNNSDILKALEDGGKCFSNGGSQIGLTISNNISAAINDCSFSCRQRNLVISLERSYLYNTNDAFCCVCIEKP